MLERDLRQFILMQQSLRSFDAGRINLGPLVGELCNLRDALEQVDPHWEHQFTRAVATLDSADQTTPEQKAELGEAFVRIVNEAVEQLNHLVEEPIVGRHLAPVED